MKKIFMDIDIQVITYNFFRKQFTEFLRRQNPQ